MPTDWPRKAEQPGETAEVQGMTARGVSEAESAQEAGGVTGDIAAGCSRRQADSRNTWKREKKLKFSYKEQREYETIEDDIANLEAKVEQLDADMAENATNSVKLGELSGGKGSGRTGTGGKDGALGVPGGAGGEDCGAGMKNITFHFTKPSFFFLFAAVR